jgi:hypothetical protein
MLDGFTSEVVILLFLVVFGLLLHNLGKFKYQTASNGTTLQHLELLLKYTEQVKWFMFSKFHLMFLFSDVVDLCTAATVEFVMGRIVTYD